MSKKYNGRLIKRLNGYLDDNSYLKDNVDNGTIDKEVLLEILDNTDIETRTLKKFMGGVCNNADILIKNLTGLVEFYKNNKGIKGLPYNPEYNMHFRNLRSIDEANEYIDSFKTAKATSLNGFIKRHGKEEGKRLFAEFQETSKSMTRENVKRILGTDDETAIRDYYQSKTPLSKRYFEVRGHDEESSKEMARVHNVNISGANRTYWENMGYSKEEIDAKMDMVNEKKSYTYNDVIDEYGKDWIDVVLEQIDTSNLKNDAYVPETEYARYERRCRLITEIYYLVYQNVIDKNLLRGFHEDGSVYHLDHILSIRDGYDLKIHPKVMGHVSNLRVITSTENLQKKSNSNLTKEELLEKYNYHESKAYN